MPILPELPQPEVKKFMMPSTASLPEADQAWVMMDISPLSVQDLLAVDDEETTMTKRGLAVFAERIKDWNFTESDGTTKVAIDVNGVIRLGGPNITYLAQQLPTGDTGLQLSVDQKKS